MSGARLAGTGTAMAGIAAVLAALTPPLPQLTGAVLAAQHTADTAGPETLLLAAAGLSAWGVWAWGALGLLLTAASGLPGAVGWCADLLVRVVLPGSARRGAALALGLGLGLAAPMAGTTLLVVSAPAAAAGPMPSTVPDWPTRAGVPDWPAPATVPGEPSLRAGTMPGGLPDPPAASVPTPAGGHVVVRGDCLWEIAAARLSGGPDRPPPTTAGIAAATQAWWAANAEVIGRDADVLLPGQVLRPPP